MERNAYKTSEKCGKNMIATKKQTKKAPQQISLQEKDKIELKAKQ